VAALALNDANILIAQDQGILVQEPGLALVDGERLLVGEAARREAHLYPRHMETRFWQRLSTAPLPRPGPRARTYADLAFAQLSQIWERVADQTQELILVLPGCLDRAQMALLLGMARELGMPVRGMVDMAVAATRAALPGETLYHLEMHLHRLVLTRLEQGQWLTRQSVEVFEGFGRLALEATLVHAIADEFVRRLRFNPLRLSAAEQALYDHLPRWLSPDRGQDAAAIELTVGAQVHRIAVQPQDLAQELRPQVEQILHWLDQSCAPGGAFALQHAGGMERFPGLMEGLARVRDCRPIALASDAAAAGALERRDAIRSPDETLRLVTRLPWGAQGAPIQPPAKGGPEGHAPSPTHILYRGLAYPIGTQPLRIGRAPPAGAPALVVRGALSGVSRLHCTIYWDAGRLVVEDHSSYGTYVNDRPLEGSAELHMGDRIRLGSPGEVLQAIALAPD
jgi:hypothetical protein